MDANFRLKNLMWLSLNKDPGLHTGLAYFPEDALYQKHILKYATQKGVGVGDLQKGEQHVPPNVIYHAETNF